MGAYGGWEEAAWDQLLVVEAPTFKEEASDIVPFLAASLPPTGSHMCSILMKKLKRQAHE